MIGGNFVRNSIDIGVSIAILAGIACGQPADNVSESTSQDPPVAGATLDQQIKQFYPPQSEIPITFSSTELEESTTLRTQQGIVQILPNGLLQYYDALAARGFPQLPDGVSDLTITSVETQYYLPPQKDLEQKIQTAQNTIDHLKAYLSDSDLKFSEVEFVVAQSSSEVKEGIKFRNEGAAIDEVAIYPVQQFQDIVEIKGEVKYGNQILPLEMTLIVHGPLGQFSKKTHLTGGKGEYTVDFLYGGILWNLKGPQQSVLETPALEYLHSTVAPFARGHAQQLMQRASTGTEAIDAIDRSDLLDEYVVHGLGRAWFEQLNTDWQLGYDMDSLKKQNRVSNWWHDENVDKMARYIAKVSPAAVIRMYQNSPEQLIAESGLKMR